MPDCTKDAKSIFLAAVDIGDAAERGAFVERSCGGDAGLKRRVGDLLRAYGQPDGPLDKLAAAMAATEIAEPIREQVGATIGPYKLMEQIGEGGFGLVFVAEQLEPIRRKVALKIIKPGMDTRDVIARFEAERQALALMDHPNIARVLDAGTTASGRPYFVMELVRGIPITDYCDQSQLTPRERLTLFVDVCNAVQHAHQKGIIHRDIKPSNVLVTLHDDRPVVKVIDFGVAKALHQHLTEKTIYTRFAQMIGTPLYMSPEQAQMSGLDIDTRSDIYSLGVLLYELLTGSTPLDKRRIAQAAYDEMLKIIREEEAPKPSVRLSQSTDTLPSIAALRKTEPARLKKMFDGDVDWIAMKALEKDRTRRYETANAFAADVRRYLNDEPVEASPPSTVYRLRKFARKHRPALVTVASFAGLLICGLIASTWLAILANRARQAAKAAERAAVESERKAKDALKQVTQERDAKEIERDRAERRLADGLLRPIGFSEKPSDPAELCSFVDWSTVKESGPKLRVLQVAFESPETALRVARRAERVVQCCVGLSPTRRIDALKLVSARQRDPAADPRIRVAACWLALALGSEDLPAWAESCAYLSDPKNKSTDRFGEFTAFATSRNDPKQLAQLDAEPLIAILATTTDGNLSDAVWDALGVLLPRLTQEQTARAWTVAAKLLEHPTKMGDFDTKGFATLAEKLDSSQIKHGWDLIIAELHTYKPGGLISLRNEDVLQGVPTRLQSEQVERLVDTLLAIARAGDPRFAASQLSRVATSLQPDHAARAWQDVVSMLEKKHQALGDSPHLATIAQRLDQQGVRQALERAISTLGTSSTAAECLAALAPRLDQAQVVLACNALVTRVARSDKQHLDWGNIDKGLEALASRMDADCSRRAADAAFVIFEQSPYFGSKALASFAPRMSSEQVKQFAGALAAMREKSPELSTVGLTALGPRLEPADVIPAWQDLLSILKSQDRLKRAAAGSLHLDETWVDDALSALAPRLPSAEAPTAWEALLAIVASPVGDDARRCAVNGLSALAPRLNPTQAMRAWTALNAIKDHRRADESDIWAAIDAVLPELPHESRNELATAATAELLDCYGSSYPYTGNEAGIWEQTEMCSRIEAARSIQAGRALARLLSHPACVGEQGNYLLQRFEELVLFDGKPVFLKDEDSTESKAAIEKLPPRQFHAVCDAAAWIQKTWPDFDLEATCPATWRGSR
jgi:serine/threonine protein kinase